MTEAGNWRGTVSQRRRALAESEITDTEYEKESLLQTQESPPETTAFCTNCCSHRASVSRVKSKIITRQNLLSNKSDVKVPYKSTSYREEMPVQNRSKTKYQLEMKVLNDELREQEQADKQAACKQKMEDVTEMLRTLSIYAHCLDMRHKVSQRLLVLVEKLVPSKQLHRPPKETTSWTSINRKLQDLVGTIGEHCELPESYADTLEEYRDKAKDFTKATVNFCKILQGNSNVSNTQLRKLELQYDEIKATYCASKSALNCHLDDLLDTRIAVVDRCLQSLCPVLGMTVECDQEMYNVLKDMPPMRDLVNPPPYRVASVKSLPERLRRRTMEENVDGRGDRCTCDRKK
uniref:AP-3 complex subunit sigma-2 n=1 Tax=Lygus hesperus TaxID=30085 RepID=A0A0A9Z4S1_LYGHE